MRDALPKALTLAGIMTVALLQGTWVPAEAKSRASEFTLENGMRAVVIPDHRAPVVTHMVFYRVGAADEPPGKSGIAHFLEHLMFKSTERLPSGEFSKIVSRLGGQDNAFTSQDTTAYFQRIAKERLAQVMAMEADRMVNLRLSEAEVATERDVILEERRSRVENNPSAILDEQMSATLFQNHPYGIPVIGWMHEMAGLTREDALAHYKRHYGPNNAILVLAGDVTLEEAQRLAGETYGKVPARGDIVARVRPKEPEPRAPRRVALEDPRAGRPTLEREYTAPSYSTAQPGEAEALDLLMKIVGGGSTSRIYRKLVVEDKIASSAGGWYSGAAMDYGRIGVYGVPQDGVTLEALEAAIDRVLDDVKKTGVTEAELERAKKAYTAEFVYQSDSQSSLARRYGFGLVNGRSIADIESFPERIARVTLDDVKQAANAHLELVRSVTGTLVPGPAATANRAGRPPRPSRS